MNGNACKTCRRGFTLIELLAVLTILGVLSGIIVRWTSVALATQRKSENELKISLSLARLDRTLRKDARHAIGTSHREGFQFECIGNKSVEYVQVGGMIERSVVLGGRTVARESYPLPDGYGMNWPETDQQVRLLDFRLVRLGQSEDPVSRIADHWEVVVLNGRQSGGSLP
jgi:prepilin-type N-terminal cleavage/methylation domain-containing protein